MEWISSVSLVSSWPPGWHWVSKDVLLTRLVVASPFWRLGGRGVAEKGSKSTGEGRSSEFLPHVSFFFPFLLLCHRVIIQGTTHIVESGRANRGLKHYIETRSVVGRLSNVNLVRVALVGDEEIGNPEATQAGLGRRSSSDSTLVANLAPASCRSSGEGRDGRGVVVSLHLDQGLDNLLGQSPAASAVIRGPEVALDAGHAVLSSQINSPAMQQLTGRTYTAALSEYALITKLGVDL